MQSASEIKLNGISGWQNKILVPLNTANLKILSRNINDAFEENKWYGREVLKYEPIFKLLCAKKQRKQEFHGEVPYHNCL